jgi:hypothetical protein
LSTKITGNVLAIKSESRRQTRDKNYLLVRERASPENPHGVISQLASIKNSYSLLS